jgi:hypothetical protein
MTKSPSSWVLTAKDNTSSSPGAKNAITNQMNLKEVITSRTMYKLRKLVESAVL